MPTDLSTVGDIDVAPSAEERRTGSRADEPTSPDDTGTAAGDRYDFLTVFLSLISTVIAPLARTEGTSKANALSGAG